MPFVTIDESPLAPEISPVEIHYRETGSGSAMVFLHGGWGYEIYPFDRQLEAFGDCFKVLIPDRTGYGGSRRLEHLPTDFHKRAAIETSAMLEALHIERPVLWGHSDGAVIATLMALWSPIDLRGWFSKHFISIARSLAPEISLKRWPVTRASSGRE